MMGNTTEGNHNAPRASPQQMIEEFVSVRILRWQAKQVKVPDREIAAQVAAMSWNFNFLPRGGPGCLLPEPNTDSGYIYVPYDERVDHLPPEVMKRIEKLNDWFKDPANGPIVRQMDKLLEREVDDKCFWEFLDGGSAERIDFLGKVGFPILSASQTKQRQPNSTN